MHDPNRNSILGRVVRITDQVIHYRQWIRDTFLLPPDESDDSTCPSATSGTITRPVSRHHPLDHIVPRNKALHPLDATSARPSPVTSRKARDSQCSASKREALASSIGHSIASFKTPPSPSLRRRCQDVLIMNSSSPSSIGNSHSDNNNSSSCVDRLGNNRLPNSPVSSRHNQQSSNSRFVSPVNTNGRIKHHTVNNNNNNSTARVKHVTVSPATVVDISSSPDGNRAKHAGTNRGSKQGVISTNGVVSRRPVASSVSSKAKQPRLAFC